MPRSARKQSPFDMYHVIMRGEGGKILFEDGEDRECFQRMLSSSLDAYGVDVYAWCMMSNHVHLLVRAPLATLARFMQSLTSGYAVYFNKRHGSIGHVFSGRYKSEPIDDDGYLLTAVRYIHFNPVKHKLVPTCDYRWSSYRDYVSGSGVTNTELVLGMLGGIEGFVRFHDVETHDAVAAHLSRTAIRNRMNDDEARELAVSVLSERQLRELKSRAKDERDDGIARLRRNGITVKQIERLTGIGRGIVDRVKWRE